MKQYATCVNSSVMCKLAYSTFFLKNIFFKKNLGSVNILSLSLVIKLRVDAAVLPSQSWVGLQVSPPGPRCAQALGTELLGAGVSEQ